MMSPRLLITLLFISHLHTKSNEETDPIPPEKPNHKVAYQVSVAIVMSLVFLFMVIFTIWRCFRGKRERRKWGPEIKGIIVEEESREMDDHGEEHPGFAEQDLPDTHPPSTIHAGSDDKTPAGSSNLPLGRDAEEKVVMQTADLREHDNIS
ncbi:hypothetical protein BLNAU_22395 [Blattamonas nauphoetae]|uniref:Uncharacterized protein n=1 Tax=Blattamonas nauphoetae TaxID=2049346 RepID=A0ABQ9WT59_9EUKA|nr:hypothetical protein BLNAU_22395 [Blattamonas nauphoetae]